MNTVQETVLTLLEVPSQSEVSLLNPLLHPLHLPLLEAGEAGVLSQTELGGPNDRDRTFSGYR